MSFYIGRKRHGATVIRQCHITHGQHDLATMEGGVMEDTVFHSNIEYIGYKHYYFDNFKPQMANGTGCGHIDVYGSTARMPVEAYEKIAAGYAYVIVTDGKIHNLTGGSKQAKDYRSGCGNWDYSPKYKWINDTESTGSIAVYFSPNQNSEVSGKYYTLRPTRYVFYEGNHAPSYIIVFNFKTDGTVDSIAPGLGEVIIKNNEFTVNGKHIFTTQYVNTKKINDRDELFTVYQKEELKCIEKGYNKRGVWGCIKEVPIAPESTLKLQLINSINSGPGIGMHSDPLGTRITYGGYNVVDSRVGAQKLSIKNVFKKSISGKRYYRGTIKLGPMNPTVDNGTIGFIAFKWSDGAFLSTIANLDGYARKLTVASNPNFALWLSVENNQVYFNYTIKGSYANIPSLEFCMVTL